MAAALSIQIGRSRTATRYGHPIEHLSIGYMISRGLAKARQP
jgi:hypothetical protein